MVMATGSQSPTSSPTTRAFGRLGESCVDDITAHFPPRFGWRVRPSPQRCPHQDRLEDIARTHPSPP